MTWLCDILTSAEFWKIAFPAFAAIVAWYVSERAKLIWEQHKKKEESYRELIRTSRGFYINTHDKDLKNAFLHQVNLCWLYAPDEVITKAYAFLESVHSGANATDKQKEDLLRAFMHAIRLDMLSRKPVKKTKLTDKDFRHLVAT